MHHLRLKKGLDLPIEGASSGDILPLAPSATLSLNFRSFPHFSARLCCKLGDKVSLGQVLVESKSQEDLKFVSPAGGEIIEIRRGLKRRLEDIVIKRDENEPFVQHRKLDVRALSQQEILERMSEGGFVPHLLSRPFFRFANLKRLPRSIFIKALESAPFAPDPQDQVKGYEKEFKEGLEVLSRLSSDLHLLCRRESFFSSLEGPAQIHTVEGIHPAANPSVHIHHIAPIRSPEDCVWTLSAHDLVVLGSLFLRGQYHCSRVIAIAGTGILEERRNFCRVRMGQSIDSLCIDRSSGAHLRFISGDVLTGDQVERKDFLAVRDFVFSVIRESPAKSSYGRELFHFFRLGIKKFTSSKCYLSGHRSGRNYDLDTHQHGEIRAFVDSGLYDRLLPMHLSTLPLVKAIISEDFPLAMDLGLLEVAAEDFALATFACPSKIPIMDIVKKALLDCEKEYA